MPPAPFLFQVLPLNFQTTVILACGYSVAFETLISIPRNWNDIDNKKFVFFLIDNFFLNQVLPLNFHTTVILACGYSVPFQTLIFIAKKLQMI